MSRVPLQMLVRTSTVRSLNLGVVLLEASLGKRGQRTAAASATIKPFEAIPGPKNWPVIGTTLPYIKGGGPSQTFRVMDKLFKEYGPIYRENMVWTKCINVCHPEGLETVFRLDGKNPHRPPVEAWKRLRELKNHSIGLFNTNGEAWYRIRQALAKKMLQLKEVNDNTDNWNDVIVDAIANFRTLRDSNNEIPDLTEQLFKWSTESVGTFVFDRRVGLFDDPPQEHALKFVEAVQKFLKELGDSLFGFPFYKYFNSPSFLRFSRADEELLNLGKVYIDEKIKSLEEELLQDGGEIDIENLGVPVLTYLLTKKELTLHEINVSAIEMFFGGVDTTSYLVGWLLYNLATNHEAQDLLHKDVTSILSRGEFANHKTLQKMPFLKACIKETLRLYPVLPVNARIINENITICGYDVPAGTQIHMNIYSLGRSEEYWDEPNKFKPQRWLRKERERFHPFAYIPFGAGPRMCIGRRIAELEASLFIAKLIQDFEFRAIGEPVPPLMKMVLKPGKPLRIQFNDRN